MAQQSKCQYEGCDRICELITVGPTPDHQTLYFYLCKTHYPPMVEAGLRATLARRYGSPRKPD
jgi:hypothetical protein